MLRKEIYPDYPIALTHSQTPRRNISKFEYETLGTLNDNPRIVTRKGDKGGIMVMMGKPNYGKKMQQHLDTHECHKKFNKNLLNNILENLTKAIKGSSIDDN